VLSVPIVKSVLAFPTANAYVDFVVVTKVDPNTSNLDDGFDDPIPTKPLPLTNNKASPPAPLILNKRADVELLISSNAVGIVVPIPIPLPLS